MPKKRGSGIVEEIGIRMIGLAAAAGLIGGVYLFRSPDTSQTIIFATGLSVASTIGAAILLRLLTR